jgi:hypothetical protein
MAIAILKDCNRLVVFWVITGMIQQGLRFANIFDLRCEGADYFDSEALESCSRE